jgi:hypothetical protein
MRQRTTPVFFTHTFQVGYFDGEPVDAVGLFSLTEEPNRKGSVPTYFVVETQHDIFVCGCYLTLYAWVASTELDYETEAFFPHHRKLWAYLVWASSSHELDEAATTWDGPVTAGGVSPYAQSFGLPLELDSWLKEHVQSDLSTDDSRNEWLNALIRAGWLPGAIDESVNKHDFICPIAHAASEILVTRFMDTRVQIETAVAIEADIESMSADSQISLSFSDDEIPF